MDRERQFRSGRLREYEIKLKKLELKASGLRESIRIALDPDEKIEDLNIQVATQQMMELYEVMTVDPDGYLWLLSEIRRIKKALGE